MAKHRGYKSIICLVREERGGKEKGGRERTFLCLVGVKFGKGKRKGRDSLFLRPTIWLPPTLGGKGKDDERGDSTFVFNFF